jgi:hypothetical protein
MKRNVLFFCAVIILFTSCRERYKYTSKVCNDKLYFEVYNINPAGVDRCYLTDSLNFKIKIGSFDEEHEKYSINCNDNDIYIFKESSGEKNCRWITENGKKWFKCDIDTIERKFYKLSDLQKLKNN